MKKLLSTKYSAAAFNTAIFLLRITVALLMLSHGYDKLIHFGDKHSHFINFLGMGSTLSYSLVVFAEFFCSLLLLIGLFTRLAAIPLIIDMGVALFKQHNGDIFGDGERAALYIGAFIVLLLLGAGKASIDSMISK